MSEQVAGRIGKVRLKSNGAELKVIPKQQTIFSESVVNMANCIKSSTMAVGFFVLDKRGTVAVGCTHDEGFTIAQLKGSTEEMKDSLVEMLWGVNE